MTSITITGRVPSKKNEHGIIPIGKGANRRFIVAVSQKFRNWHKEAMKQLIDQNAPKDLEARPESVVITFYPPDRIRGDLTNKAESIMDLLVDYGTLRDDNWFEIGNLTLHLGGVDREQPRAEIKIHYQ